MEESRAVVDLTDSELLDELYFVDKMNKFWYGRKEEIMKEIERRATNGRNNIN